MTDQIITVQNSSAPWRDYPCAPWCYRQHLPDHAGDPACWSDVDHYIPLSLEDGFPAHALRNQAMRFDPPRIGLNAYRREPGCIEIVHMHLYRPSENKHLDLDSGFDLTVSEAQNLIEHLNEVIAEIKQSGGASTVGATSENPW